MYPKNQDMLSNNSYQHVVQGAVDNVRIRLNEAAAMASNDRRHTYVCRPLWRIAVRKTVAILAAEVAALEQTAALQVKDEES